MNHMTEVAKMFGVKVGDEFEFAYKIGNIRGTAYFTEYSFIVKDADVPANVKLSDWESMVLAALLYGDAEITRKPWIPEDNERFYVVLRSGIVTYKFWDDCTSYCNYYKIGNLYRTYEEAEANVAKWVEFYNSGAVLDV